MAGARVPDQVCGICGDPDGLPRAARYHAACVAHDRAVARTDAAECRQLWCAVLLALAEDLRPDAVPTARDDAIAALREPEWIEFLCDLAGVEHAVVDRLRAMATPQAMAPNDLPAEQSV